MKREITGGFTLIEVLIAMTLLSMMVVLLFASLKICADSWHKGEDKLTAVNEVAVVYHFFQTHLSTAKPLLKQTQAIENLQAPLAFQGKPHSLQFVSAFPASAGRTGLQLFSIAMASENNEQVIKVTMTPFFSARTGAIDNTEDVILLRHVRDFSLTYFGSDDGSDNSLTNSVWRDEWLEKNIQPRLIKMAIKLDNDLFLPEMIFALKITGQPMNNAVLIQ